MMLCLSLLVNRWRTLPQYVWVVVWSDASRGRSNEVSMSWPNEYCETKKCVFCKYVHVFTLLCDPWLHLLCLCSVFPPDITPTAVSLYLLSADIELELSIQYVHWSGLLLCKNDNNMKASM